MNIHSIIEIEPSNGKAILDKKQIKIHEGFMFDIAHKCKFIKMNEETSELMLYSVEVSNVKDEIEERVAYYKIDDASETIKRMISYHEKGDMLNEITKMIYLQKDIDFVLKRGRIINCSQDEFITYENCEDDQIPDFTEELLEMSRLLVDSIDDSDDDSLKHHVIEILDLNRFISGEINHKQDSTEKFEVMNIN